MMSLQTRKRSGYIRSTWQIHSPRRNPRTRRLWMNHTSEVTEGAIAWEKSRDLGSLVEARAGAREDKRPHNFSLVLGSSRGARLAHMESRIIWRGDCSLLSRLESMLDREAVSGSEKCWFLQLVFSTFFGCQRLAVSSIYRNDSTSVCGSLFSCKNPAPTLFLFYLETFLHVVQCIWQSMYFGLLNNTANVTLKLMCNKCKIG